MYLICLFGMWVAFVGKFERVYGDVQADDVMFCERLCARTIHDIVVS